MTLPIALFALASVFAQGIDHAPFDALLRANVAKGLVNYPGFQDSAPFKAYVADLAKGVPLAAKADQLAYNINAYNAFAIQGILDGLSPSSTLGRVRYFKLQDWPLNGRKISLYDLEHKVLRPLGDPRIHFAIICASRSCPFLRPESYTAAALDAQLDDQARQFVNDPFPQPLRQGDEDRAPVRDLQVVRGGLPGRGLGAEVHRALRRRPEVAKDLAQDGYKIQYIDYDWNLNGNPPRR
jgi:hypothetical protein